MTKSVELETAVFADAVMRASRIAPSKGRAFDIAAGILIDVVPGNDAPVRISATDLDVTFYQRVPVVDIGDEAVSWRVPSALAAGWLSNLPMSAGKTIKLSENDNRLVMKSGRSRTKMRLLPAADFPRITPFDPALLADVPNFARRIQQVAWAALTNGVGPLTGIFITGDDLIACDRVRIAIMPCPVPAESPFSAPLTTLATVLRNVDDVKLRVTDSRIEIMTDVDTQLTASLYAEPYPDARQAISRIVLDHELVFSREQLMDALQRMLVLVKGERYPRIDLTFHADRLDLKMILPEVGEMEDVVDVTGGPDEPFEILFSPTNLLGVVTNAMRETLHLHFAPDAHKPVKFTDESGFVAWLMPMERV